MSCCGGRKRQPIKALPPLNVASALEAARAQFQQTADPHLIEKRIQLCKTCTYFQNDLCHRCGCYVVGKIGKSTESCPLRRW